MSPGAPLVLLYGPDYWREIVNFDALVRHGVIAAEDLGLFRWADSPAAAFEILKAGLAPGAEAATPAFAHSTPPHAEERP